MTFNIIKQCSFVELLSQIPSLSFALGFLRFPLGLLTPVILSTFLTILVVFEPG